MAKAMPTMDEVRQACRDYFSRAPGTGCGSGRDDHDCATCQRKEREHSEWQERRSRAAKLLQRFGEVE